MLLTMKPMIYACNVGDADLATGNKMSESVFAMAKKEGAEAVLVSAQVRIVSLCEHLSP
jgi:ribosome-binding ATPase YchF (GTP1/OBG family)